MKKTIILFIMFIFSILSVFPNGINDTRKINIVYSHSTRIPYNKISINIGNFYGKYLINFETLQMQNKTYFENTNTVGEIIIEKEYFEKLFNDFLAINFNEIILKNVDLVGLDGFSIELEIGSFINIINFNVWSPKYNSENRGTEKLNELFIEIFETINLSEYY